MGNDTFDNPQLQKVLVLRAQVAELRRQLDEATQLLSQELKTLVIEYGKGPYDIGDQHPVGHIVKQRGGLYFMCAGRVMRERGDDGESSLGESPDENADYT